MTRKECEKKIAELVEQIREVYKEYRGEEGYLSIALFPGTIYFNNKYFAEDSDFPIEYYVVKDRKLQDEYFRSLGE